MAEKLPVRLRVNGRDYEGACEPRKLLVDFIREDLGLTGTHLGCEHGVCGACTILMDGEAVRSCLLFAVQADGAELLTVEGLAYGDQLHPIQDAYWEAHGLQCGFCTPGFLITTLAFLRENPPKRRGETAPPPGPPAAGAGGGAGARGAPYPPPPVRPPPQAGRGPAP